MERGYREFGLKFFYLWGDTVTLNVKIVQRVLRRADRAQAARAVVRQRARRQPDGSGVREAAAPGRLLDAGARHRDGVRRDAQGHDEAARRPEDPHGAREHARRPGIRSFGFFILGYPGDTPTSLDRTIDYAIELDPDFANFYPAVPYPGTDLYAKAKREGLLASEDWSRMEYSYYQMRGNGLDEAVVLDAINRAKRRFYLRPGYMARHAGDILRLASTKWNLAWHVGSRVVFGTPVTHAHGGSRGRRRVRSSRTLPANRRPA